MSTECRVLTAQPEDGLAYIDNARVTADSFLACRLAKGLDVEGKNGGVFSPLTTSIRENRKAIFHYLIDEARADPNSPGEHLPIIKAVSKHVKETEDQPIDALQDPPTQRR